MLELTRIIDMTTGVELPIDDHVWYAELLRLGITHHNVSVGRGTRDWCKRNGCSQTTFCTGTGGLLAPSESKFSLQAQRVTAGLLLPIQELYAGLMFGLLALDLFTTTGARLNEILQISLSKSCLVRLTIPAPVGAEDQRPRIRYSLRLTPKGERKDMLHDYFIGEETKRMLVRVGQMLAEHYEIGTRGSLPSVPFCPSHRRAHRFRAAPYIFQLHGNHLRTTAISACLRFPIHGLSLRTKDNQRFALTAHLLRHAFATHAVQVERIPVDIVGRWLHQKTMSVTQYYAEATESMVADAADSYLGRIATHVDIDTEVARSPQELKQLYEDAAERAGTLASVPGGTCVSHGFCKAHFSCIGCAGKVPDPDKRDQVIRKVEWAKHQIQFFRREGLTPEARQLEKMVQDAAVEMREMDMIEHYRADEAPCACRGGAVMARRQQVSPSWLSPVYAKRRKRTVALTRRAIELLKKHKQPISLANVGAATKQIDELKCGLSLTTLLRNSDAPALYVQHRAWKPRVSAGKRDSKPLLDPAKLIVEVDRDEAAARGRLRKLSKRDLIERVMLVEHCYAVVKQRWIRVTGQALE